MNPLYAWPAVFFFFSSRRRDTRSLRDSSSDVCSSDREIRAEVTPATLVVSAAALVPTSYIEGRLERGVPVVRAMPNTPCQVGAGMTGICRGSHATDAHLQAARQLFDTVGRTVVVDETHMDAVAGLSASGPASV